MTLMINKTQLIENYLDEILPDAGCELIYNKPYEFVICVMLSAQTTDKAVNKVSKILFEKYNSLESFANAKYSDIELIIRPLGLSKVKSVNIIGIANKLLDSFNGIVPNNKDDLLTLPGVGEKTAGVVLAEIYHYPNFPVDTHVKRISYRLGFTKKNEDPNKVKKVLENSFDQPNWIKLHHQFIHFGRYYCLAKNPKCENCKLSVICEEKHAN